ncbi:hypothetical protein G314FT_17030 [Vagococcus luciliae]|uniref:Transglycosylase n=2 Tax=Lactobacillales TaxID=186826 RepID=A0ABY5P0U5_9ENTE|nr:hypothetical protein G314FT_17030 [Vagococcus luciliae]
MMHWISVLIVGSIIGAVATLITGKKDSQGCLFNLVAGLLGSAIGQKMFGDDWGGQLAGMALVPSILGAIIIVAIASIFQKK